MVLALMRLLDTPRHALRLEYIARTLGDPHVIDALAVDRAPFPEAKDQMKQDFARRAGEAIALIGKYSRGGSDYAICHKLQRMRARAARTSGYDNGGCDRPQRLR